MRRVGVITVGRSDYGILRPVIRGIQADDALELLLFVSGAHLLPHHGATVGEIERDGLPVAERIEMLDEDDSPASLAAGLGRGVAGFAAAYARHRPDLLLVLGDRFEMLAAVVASLPFGIPVAHVHGGETTEGAVDDAVRHAITKLSHLHFVAAEPYARRLIAMGEEPWRVVVSGAPALDGILDGAGSAPAVEPPYLLCTWHPVTLEQDEADAQLAEVFAALAAADQRLIVTHPNADPGRAAIVERIERLARERDGVLVEPNLGFDRWVGAMRHAAAVVGNSSSGILEAASFQVPVVNIGNRQHGRIRAANVIDVRPEREAIGAAIKRATSAAFRASLHGLVNPYGDGRAAERIVIGLRAAPLGRELLVKRLPEAA